MSGGIVRPLQRADLAEYRTLRLAALRNHPEAFGVTYEEEAAVEVSAQIPRMLPEPPGLGVGAEVDGQLVGIAGMLVPARLKTRHKGRVYGVYVDPGHRRSGLARLMMDALLTHARTANLLAVQLSVTVGNESARRFYMDLGFRPFGIERRALCIDGRFFDLEEMEIDLA